MSTRGMMSILRRDGSDLDFVEHLRLQRAHLVQADQLEQGQERNDDLNPRDDLAKQFGKTHRRSVAHALQDILNFIGHTEPFAKDFLQVLSRLDPFDYFLKCMDQLENSNFVQRQWRVCNRDIAGEDSFLFERAIVQLRSGLFELLVFDQLANQIPARIVLFGIFLRRLLIERKQAAALQINEIRCHDHELARDVDLQLFESLEIFKILARDSFDRNIVNIDLVALDQVKQEIERPFKNFELNLVVGLHVSTNCRWHALEVNRDDLAATMSDPCPTVMRLRVDEPKHCSRRRART